MFRFSPLAAVCLLFLLTSALPGQESKPDADPEAQAEKLFQDGRKAMFQGNYEQAVKDLRAAVEADPSGTKTIYRLHLARAFRYAKQPQESEKLLKEILEQSPDHVEAGQLLAEIYYAGQRWEDIAKVLEPLLKYRHDYPTYHYLAEATYNLDQFEKARQYYKEAIKLNPRSAFDQYQLGNIYLAEKPLRAGGQWLRRGAAFGAGQHGAPLQARIGVFQPAQLLRQGVGRQSGGWQARRDQRRLVSD